jgi:hypothetical protein
MSEGIVNHGDRLMIFDGGTLLPGCPESPEQAKAWREAANGEKEEWTNPLWSWDCGFKLDYDGPLVSVSSRFYPPKSHYGATWDGTVHIRVLDKEVVTKEFDCPTLDELREKVESFVASFTDGLAAVLGGALAKPAEPCEAEQGNPQVTSKGDGHGN